MQLSLLYHYANVISTFNLKNIFFFNKILMVALHLKKLSYILHKILNQRMPSLHWLTTRLSIDLSYLSLYLMFNSVNCIITLKMYLSISELEETISKFYFSKLCRKGILLQFKGYYGKKYFHSEKRHVSCSQE